MARYWALKRESRCGAALLHRLVSSKLKTTIDYSHGNFTGQMNSSASKFSSECEPNQELCDLSSHSLFSPYLSNSEAVSKISQTCMLLERYKKLSLILHRWSHIVGNNVIRERVGVEFAEAGFQMVMSLAKEVFNAAILPVWAILCDSDKRHNYMDLALHENVEEEGENEFDNYDHYEALGGFRFVKERIDLLKYSSVKEFQTDVDSAIQRLEHYFETQLQELQEKGKRVKARDPELVENADDEIDESVFQKLEKQVIRDFNCGKAFAVHEKVT